MFRVLRVFAAVLCIGIFSVSVGSDALSDTKSTEAAFDHLAKDLLRGIKTPARVALVPLSETMAGLPREVAKDLDHGLLAALRGKAGRGVRLILRDGLAAAWEEAIEFQGRTVPELVSEAKADILVIGDATATTDGLRLAYRAVSLSKGKVGRVLAAPAAITVPRPDEDLAALRFLQSLWKSADALAAAMARKIGGGDGRPIEVNRPPPAGDFQRYLGEILTARLQRELRRLTRASAVPVGAEATAGDPIVLHLALDIWDHGDAVSVAMTLMGPGAPERRDLRLEPSLIPSHFLPLTRDGGKVGAGMARARGAAWSGAEMPEQLALAGARSLARARAVAAALGATMPVDGVVRSSAQMSGLRRMMERGIPHDEVWTSEAAGSSGDVAVALRALVEPVGGPSAPLLGIGFAGADLVAGNDLELNISNKRGVAHIAVFAWYEDDGVVRLYPAGGTTPVRVEAGQSLILPPPEGPVYGVAPMPGQRVSSEALILLASSVPFDAAALASTPLDDPLSSLHRARAASAFFDALARLDLSIMTIRILGYRVRADD